MTHVHAPHDISYGAYVAASAKQTGFIKKLIAERATDIDYQHTVNVHLNEGMTKAEASDTIGFLLKRPYASKKVATPATSHLEAGKYYTDGAEIFHVKNSKTGHLYAMHMQATGRGTGKWFYAPGAMKNSATWIALTVGFAEQYGLKYSFCGICGRTLTALESISAGIGPICAEKI